VEAVETTEVKEAVGQDINLEASHVQYTGYKQLGDKHTGKLFFSGATVDRDDNDLEGGRFVIDINSLTNEDLEGDAKGNFVGHMKSADFLEAEKYPTAAFEITSVEQADSGSDHSHVVNGNMTIKDVTKEISFPANISAGDDGLAFSGSLEINRTDYNMKWGSKNFVKDLAANRIVKDLFDMDFHIVMN